MLLKLILFFFGMSVAQASDLSRSESWLRLYQYEKSGSHYRSPIDADRFFFSPSGRTDPAAEFSAAIDAFSHPEKNFGTQKQSAACVFPARLRVVETLTGQHFPSVHCRDLDDWISRIGADEAYLVFVGAYSGNPASILGHTFLRLGRSAQKRLGEDLLSYSVGFLAQTAGGDNRLTYMVKGLTGGYPGSYEIEPHYMKVGLYNNSESRDLWELKLRLSVADVRMLVLHLWELTFNAQIPYYFIDENCSYRLLTLIEAIKPEMKLSAKLATVVLPAETMRAALDSGWSETLPRFRASILRRLNYKLDKFTSDERKDFALASHSLTAVREELDPKIIDALLDYWLYQNYRVQAQLPREQTKLMEAVYARSSQLKMPAGASDAEIENNEKLRAPFQGHRPRWLEVGAGALTGPRTGPSGSLKYRSGVHPFWSNDPAYQDITAIEYLGVELQASEGRHLKWQGLLIDAKSFENTFGFGHPLAWSINIHVGNNCLFCESEAAALNISGGVGVAFRRRSFVYYSLVQFESATWWQEGVQEIAAPGLLVGFRGGIDEWSLILEGSRNWCKQGIHTEGESRISYALNLNRSLFLKVRESSFEGGRSESAYTLGWTEFFN